MSIEWNDVQEKRPNKDGFVLVYTIHREFEIYYWSETNMFQTKDGNINQPVSKWAYINEPTQELIQVGENTSLNPVTNETIEEE